jgi:hypothetical protein
MNKTKKVAWHKHLVRAQKNKEKRIAQKASGATTTTSTSTARR